MREKPGAIVAVLVAAVAIIVVGMFAYSRLTSQVVHEGTDSHEEPVDPVLYDPYVAAEANVAALISIEPATQNSPYDSYARIKDRLAGPLRQLADNPPTDQQSKKTWPRQWDAWKANGDAVQGFATRTSDTPEIKDTDTEGHVFVEVTKKVIHRDGTTTPLAKGVADVEMVKEEGVWKTARFSYKSIDY